MRGGDGDRESRSPYLPSGYRLDDESDPDFAVLRRRDGPEVAVFSATGADPAEIERSASGTTGSDTRNAAPSLCGKSFKPQFLPAFPQFF